MMNKKIVLLCFVWFGFLSYCCADDKKGDTSSKSTPLTSQTNTNLINITLGDKVVNQIPCERIEIFSSKPAPVDKKGVSFYRGEANTGKTKNGDIYAAVVGTKSLYKSQDGGKKWARIPLSPMQDYMAAFTVLQDDSLLFLKRSYTDDKNEKMVGMIWRSTNYGEKWQVFSSISPAPFDGICEGLQSLTQLRDGTILFPTSLWMSKPESFKEPASTGRRQNVVFFSKDGGKTWLEKAKTFDYVAEAQILELQSGKLLATFRYQRSRLPEDTDESIKKLKGDLPDKSDESVFKQIFVGDSLDKGKTWVNLRPIQDKEGNALLIFGECHGQLVQVPDGRVVLVHDHRYPYEKSQVMARVSEDEGKTWNKEAYRVSFGAGYPSSVVLQDGTIVTVTGTNITNSKAQAINRWTVGAIRWKLPEIKGTTK